MKSSAIICAVTFYSFLFAFQAASAQSVRIRVTDEQKAGLTGANVQLNSLRDSSTYFGVTDPSGAVVFEKMAAGSYGILVTYIGYESLEDTIEVLGFEQQNLEFSLKEQSVALNAVTVTARRPLITQEGDKTIVDPAPLVSISSNALELLETIPGMFVDQEGGIYLTSASPAQIYINGREQRMSPQDMTAILRSLPPGSIQRIEILRTPSTRYDAASTGGIVNIILKKGVKLGRFWSVNAGMNQGVSGDRFAGFSLNDSGDKAAGYLNVNYNRNGQEEESHLFRGLSADYNLDQTSRTRTQSDEGYAGYGLSYDMNDKVELTYDGRVNGALSHSDSRNTSLITAQEDPPLSEIDNRTENYSPSLSLSQDLGLSWKLDTIDSVWDNKFSFSYRNGSTEQDYQADILFPALAPVSGEGLNLQKRHFFLFQSDLTYNFPGQTKLEAGIKSTYQGYDSRADYLILENDSLRVDEQRTNAFQYRENINAAYAQASRPLLAGFVLKAGLRLEHTWMKGRQTVPADTSFFINRADLFPYLYLSRPIMKVADFRLDGYLIYRKTISRPGYQNLNPYIRYIDEFTYETGNPGLRPQFTHNIEANVSFDDTPLFAIGQNFTEGIMSNVLYPDETHPEIAVRTYDNVGKSRETYFRAVGGLPPGKKYFFVAGAQYNLNEYDGAYFGQPLSYRRGSWKLFTFHSLHLTRNTRFTLSGFVWLNGQQNFYELETLGQLNMSLNQSFFGKKLQVSLFARDVLHTMDTQFHFSQGDLILHGDRYSDNQRFGIRIRYDAGLKKKEEGQDMMRMDGVE